MTTEAAGRPALTPETARELLRDHLAVLGPGEVLVLRTADWTPNQVREYQRVLDAWHYEGDLPFRAVMVAGDEMAVVKPDAAGDAEPEFRGVVIIEWPESRGPLPYSALPGPACTVTDAVTGKLITTCTAITVRATVDEIITADLTLSADAEGNPVLDGKPVLDPDGREVLTGTFPFAVAEMRVRGKA